MGSLTDMTELQIFWYTQQIY